MPKLEEGPPTLVRFECPSRARIDAHAHLATGEEFSVRLQLQQGAGVETHALVDQGFEVFRQLLRRELNVRRGNACAHRPAGLEAAGGVDLKPGAMQHANHRGRGAGLHGIARGQPKRVRKRQHFLRPSHEGLFVIDKHGGAEFGLYAADLIFREKCEAFHKDCGSLSFGGCKAKG